jgi:hypothetical protein
MRRISEEQRALGCPPAFFASTESPFVDPRDWLTLIHLVAEDYARLGAVEEHPADPGHLLDRIEDARRRAGAAVPIAGDERADLERAIAADAADLAAALPSPTRAELETATVVIEFARGGPEGTTPPLPFPIGYEHSLAALSPEILQRASILYVWVTPEESRRRNQERALPGRDGDASILHHGVPDVVMRQNYGVDDIAYLAALSPEPGTIAVPSGDDIHLLPLARFDNRVDQTSFLRGDPAGWPPDSLASLRTRLALALDGLVDEGVDSGAAE